MSLISRLGVVLGIDTAEFNAGLGLAQEKLNNFGTAVLGNRLGVAALVAGITAAAASAIRFADHINDVSQSSELSVQTILRLNQALMTNGGNAETASRLMSGFEKSVYAANHQSDSAQKAFKSLGITMQDLKKLDTQTLLDKTIKGLAGVTDGTTRMGTAFQIFSKAARNIDFKGVADDLEKTKDSFKDSEQAFQDIGTALDNLQRISFTFKTNFATNIGTPFKLITDAFIAYYNWIAKINSGLDEMLGKWAKIKNFVPLFAVMPNKQIATAADVKADAEAQKQAEREQELTKEYENQQKALEKQLLSMELENQYLGVQKTKLAEISNEFKEHGKFYLLQGTAEEAQIKRQAKIYDIKSQAIFYENEKRVYDVEIERLQLQAQMAGFGDIEQKQLLAQFDLEKKLNEEKRKGLLNDDEAAAIMKVFLATQKQQQATLAAQQTFSAGWSKAYNDWVDQSKNAAALGKQAFEGMIGSLSNALDEFVKTGKLNFKSLIADMIQQLIRLQLQAQMSGLFSMLGNSLGFNGGGSSTPFTGGINLSSYLGTPKAGGGAIDSPSLVGENGPEIFIPRSAGTIIPNNSLASVMGSQPQVVYNGPYIANMSAIDTQSATQFLTANKQTIWAANQSAQRSLPQGR